MPGAGVVVSVNVGRPRTVEWHGRRVRSAIWKSPVDGPVDVRDDLVEGDAQADRRVHGGPDKAVYAYASEDYEWWAARWPAERPAIAPGLFGENLTTAGVDVSAAVEGDRWAVGDVVLEVAQPRQPCFKLGMRIGNAEFVKEFGAAARFGVYLRIVRPGTVRAGDTIVPVSAG